MKKIVKISSSFNKKIEELEKKQIYSLEFFKEDLKDFFKDEKNKKFRKHKIQRWKNETIFSISLRYDLRTLYFFEKKKDKEIIEYIFFDIWNHNDVYQKNKKPKWKQI